MKNDVKYPLITITKPINVLDTAGTNGIFSYKFDKNLSKNLRVIVMFIFLNNYSLNNTHYSHYFIINLSRYCQSAKLIPLRRIEIISKT